MLANESSDDSSSVCSTEKIEKEIVGKLKNMFEVQISDSKEKQSTFLNWKKDNLFLKGTDTSPKLNRENETKESSDSESSDRTVKIQSKDSEITRKLDYDLMVGKADVRENYSGSNGDDISDNEYEMKMNIGRESVNKLKGVYESLASKSQENTVFNGNKNGLRKTKSLGTFTNQVPSIFRETKSHGYDDFDRKEGMADGDNDERDNNRWKDDMVEGMIVKSADSIKNIKKESVSKLKDVFEGTSGRTSMKDQQGVSKANITKSTSMINLGAVDIRRENHREEKVENDSSASSDISDNEKKSENSSSICNDMNHEKDTVIKLKTMYEDITKKSKHDNFKNNNIRKTMSMSSLVNETLKPSNSQDFLRNQKENDQDYVEGSFHSFSSSMLTSESKEDVLSETSVSDNENNHSEVQWKKLSEEDGTQNEEEKLRKTSVKHLADRFSNESLDGNTKVNNI